ncbi:MAG: M48 family metallopeptidase [Gammaproteobacteria bacterium]
MSAPGHIDGRYYDGQRPVGSAATLVLGVRDAALIGERVTGRYAVRALRVSPRTGDADRFIAFPNGGQLQCADSPLLDRLPHEVRSEGIVAWLERRVVVAVVCIVFVIAALGAGYRYGLPRAADYAAARIPIETEQTLGKQALAWLDEHEWFLPTEVDAEAETLIRDRFARLHADLPLAAHYRLEFRDAPKIGANAFALPGGTIVITDQMIDAAESLDEVLAVLAHEIGHVERRHTMRHLLRDSATAALVATVTGDAASLSVAVATIPALLARAKYSRDFETEADDFGFALLRRHDISPAAFASLMERLSEKHKDAERAIGFISTHPLTAERIEKARAAAP